LLRRRPAALPPVTEVEAMGTESTAVSELTVPGSIDGETRLDAVSTSEVEELESEHAQGKSLCRSLFVFLLYLLSPV
jgi:hypothetical protein